MTLERKIARTFGLKKVEDWRRHANPLSFYTRLPIPWLLVAAIWSHNWIGWWALVPVGIVLVWTAINPKAFPPPRSYDHWASRAVFGEMYWAARKRSPIPKRHRIAPVVLTGVAATGLPFTVSGIVAHDAWIAAFGLLLQSGGKLWFIDRMALLYDDMKAEDPSDFITHQPTSFNSRIVSCTACRRGNHVESW